MVRHRAAFAAGALHGRGDSGSGAGVLSLCLPVGAHGVPGSGQRPDGSRASAWAIAMASVLAGGHADGASRHRRGRGVGVDGNPGGFRRGVGVQLRYLHDGYLQDLVRIFQSLYRRTTGQSVAAGGDGGAVRRASCPRRQPGKQRTATGQGVVSPAWLQSAAGHRLVRVGVRLRLRHSDAATGGVVLAAGAPGSG
ncbi:hypothetical protein D3C85_1231750 [compost metagenome]